jgi:hypothetical protein
MKMDEHHNRSAESGPTRKQIIQAFETIRLKLVDNLEEPERSAFWLAVQMRDALRNAAPAQPALDRDNVARTIAEQLGENFNRLPEFHLQSGFCKDDFYRCADALAAQPQAAPVKTSGCEWPACDLALPRCKTFRAPNGCSAGTVEAALRDAFPHFQDGSEITPEAIRGIGKEYLDMVMSWEPHKDEIEFADHNGTIRKIVYEPGDYEVGINPGWVLEDDTLDQPQTAPDLSKVLESCKGEHLKFEEWAAGQKYDMTEHPLHYLFTDTKTYHARQGWKAALRYVAEATAVTRPHEGGRS